MRAYEISPAHALASFRSWFDALSLEDVSHGLVAHLMPKVSERTGNPPISPMTVVACQLQDQLLDGLSFWGTLNLGSFF
jgi:hypothetical protein